ncbi:MAG: serine hydrolase [Planctomycetota bacterium]
MLAPLALSLSLLTALALARPGQAQINQLESPKVPAELNERIEAFLASHHAIDQLSGSVLIAEGDDVIYRGAYGLANSDWNIANTIDTKFRLASITKQFTSMLTLMLVRDGVLDLDAPMTTWLPDYPKESGDRVTLRHLLNHTSGIPSYTDIPGFLRTGLHDESVEEFVRTYCSDPLDFEPGTDFHYNNSAYFILGAIIEKVTGRTFRDVLHERILDPLGMDSTGMDDESAVVTGRATGYDDVLGGRRLALWLDMSVPYAAGGMYSTVDDLFRWSQALDQKTLLDGELEAEMVTPGLGNYAFGWYVDLPEDADSKDGPTIHHSGGMPGVSTLIWRQPAKERCVIVLGNSGTTAHYAIQYGLIELLEGRTPGPVRPRGDLEISRRVLDDGIEAALEDWKKWPENVRVDFIERDMNAIGYQLMEQRRFDEAQRIFEFLTVAYPDSANTWDSLGEWFARVGRTDEAIANYEKALELDPDSETVPAILERLRSR